MRETPTWRRYLRLLGSRPAADVDEELAFHVTRRVEDLVSQGLSQAEARDRAAREFGNVERVRRELQAIGRRRLQREKRAHWWESLAQDLRFAGRTLRKSPGFVAVVVATLALGIGGTTAVFSAVQGVLLAPLPYEEPGQLVRFYQGPPPPAEARGTLTGPHFKDAERRAIFQEELAERMRTIPGVTASAGTSRLPATGSDHTWHTVIERGPRAGTEDVGMNVDQRIVSGDFFAALEIPVLVGRVFDQRDDANAPSRAVVSADFARQAFPGMPLESVVGQRIAPAYEEREIIGVVRDVRLDAYGTPASVVYQAHRQYADNRNWALSQVVATEVPPERILAAVRAEVAALDPQLVVHRAAPLTEVVGRGVSRERFALVLMGAFAAVALALAALGLYGVLAYSVRQRTQEIGIRMALGATAAHVRALVLRQAGTVVGIGLVGGIAGALALGRGLSSLLFETSPSDPRVFVATALLLTVVAFIAAWLPARRASRVEPKTAMQAE